MVHLDAPLGLCNVLTVLCAFGSAWTLVPQARGALVRPWALAVPPALASVVAVVLLAGVFNATALNDGEWLAALVLGVIVGRARGWSLSANAVASRDTVRLRPAWDGMAAAALLVMTAIVDFISAAASQPIVAPIHVASMGALCAGFLGGRALAVLVRFNRFASRRPT